MAGILLGQDFYSAQSRDVTLLPQAVNTRLAGVNSQLVGFKSQDAIAASIVARVGSLRRGWRWITEQVMLSNIFNPRKRAASRELEIALYYLLHDAEKLVPLMKQMYRKKWPGFIDDILNGARPYEEATVLISIFLQQAFRNHTDQAERKEMIEAVALNNLVDPPNLLRIIGQVAYFLRLAERDGQVRKNHWIGWLNEWSKVLIETGKLTREQCGTFFCEFANQYGDRLRIAANKEQAAAKP
jgi:hypothetical protein